MSIDLTKPVSSITVDGDDLPLYHNLQDKVVVPSTQQQIIEAGEGYDGIGEVICQAVTSSIDSNIQAENIKKDVTILGVTGTLESGGGKLPQVVDGSVTELTAEDLYGATQIIQNAFGASHRNLVSVELPSTVTTIYPSAFSNCSSLTSVTIPNSVTTIYGKAFEYTGLTSVTIPSSVTTLYGQTFQYCRSLTSVTLPEGLLSIGTSEFASCSALTNLTIPSTVTTIKGSALSGSGITTLTILATTPPNLSYAFDVSLQTIYIPAGTLSAYQSATNWSTFSSIFVELSN